MTDRPERKYHTVAEIDGLKYEVVKSEKIGLFGEPIFQACTFGMEMHSVAVRRTLGTFKSWAAARARIEQELRGPPSAQSGDG